MTHDSLAETLAVLADVSRQLEAPHLSDDARRDAGWILRTTLRHLACELGVSDPFGDCGTDHAVWVPLDLLDAVDR